MYLKGGESVRILDSRYLRNYKSYTQNCIEYNIHNYINSLHNYFFII